MLTNLLIIAILQVESGGDWKATGDGGRALGGLQIQAIMVRHYNEATGSSVKHTEARNPAELYQCWNAGPDSVKRGQSVARGKRVHGIYSNLAKKERK